jgi:hypothetical protein
MQEFTGRARRHRPTSCGWCSTRRCTPWARPASPSTCCAAIGIPLVKIDRGGQITYHGPGQVVAYLLLDLHRRHLKVREWSSLEQAVIDCIADYGLDARRKDGAPASTSTAPRSPPSACA